jgi:hypothetical protein
MGIGSGLTISQGKMRQQFSLIEGGLFSAMTASQSFIFFAFP